MSERQRNNKEIQMPQQAWDMLYLASCALNGRKPDEDKVAQMDLDSLRKMSMYHKVEAMICMALEETETFRNSDLFLVQRWKQEKGKAIRKNMLLDAARKQVLAAMEAAGIWYVPLKGSILQYMYPRYGMRQNGDVDILYDASCQKRLKSVMEGCGFVAESVGKEYHDIYIKPSVCDFEMHTMLAGKDSPEIYSYYKNVQKRLLYDEESEYGRHFGDEDFYIYNVAHMFKHFMSSGTGFRPLADIYVYLDRKGGELDWEYVRREAEALGMAKFEKGMRMLCRKIFGNGEMPEPSEFSQKETALLAELAQAGVYGTQQGRVERKMEELRIEKVTLGTARGRIKYILKRLFPDMEWFRRHEPFCAEHKICIPFFLVYRVVRQLFRYRKSLGKELRTLHNMAKNKNHT